MTTLHSIAVKSRAVRKALPAPAPASIAIVFPPDVLDPWDAEAPPELWPDDCDDDVWQDSAAPEPEGDDDHLWNYEPTPDERREAAEIFAEMAARDHLDQSTRLTLAEFVALQSTFYQTFDHAAGDLIAEALAELAGRIADVQATTVTEFKDREDVMDNVNDDIEVYRRNCRTYITRGEARERLRSSWAGMGLGC